MIVLTPFALPNNLAILHSTCNLCFSIELGSFAAAKENMIISQTVMFKRPHLGVLAAFLISAAGCSGSNKASVSSAEAGLESEPHSPVVNEDAPADILAAGRALEAGDIKTAKNLVKNVKETKGREKFAEQLP